MDLSVVRVGDEVQDCDPRYTHRRGRIVELFPNGVRVDWGTARTVILARRLHTKGIRSGMRLCVAAEVLAARAYGPLLSEQPAAAPLNPSEDQ